jgi:hypothetical protein
MAKPLTQIIFNPPDWKDGNAYSNLKTASLAGIAWQFLRRNGDYQLAWQEYEKQTRKFACNNTKLSQYVDYILLANPTKTDYEKLGEDGIDQNEQSRALRNAGHWYEYEPKRWQMLDCYLGQKWGLKRIVHPDAVFRNFTVEFLINGTEFTILSSAGLEALEKSDGVLTDLGNTKWLVPLIDLSMPLEVLQANIMGYIKTERDYRIKQGYVQPVKQRALSNAKYIEYLQIFDGNKAGASIAEIGLKVAPKQQNTERQRDKRIREALNTAIALVDGGYLSLPQLQRATWSVKKK